jgi:hypothetical protein
MELTNKNLRAALLAAPLVLCHSGVVVADEDVDRRINDLEQQLQDLKGELSETKNQSEANRAKAAELAAADEEKGDGFVAKKGTTFTIGGYVKLDALYTNYSKGKPSGSSPLIEDFLIGSLIPVEAKEGENDAYQSLNMHAKETRINFATASSTGAGLITSFIEMDFFILREDGDERVSNSWGGRLRHAFVKWQYSEHSYFLAGQFWSAFFNTAALPDSLDFVGTIGTVFERQPMLQWGWSGFILSLENPYSRLNLSQAAGDEQSDSEVLPDVVLRYDGKAGNLGWMVAGLGRQLSYDQRGTTVDEAGNKLNPNEQVADDTEFGYGLNFSGVWKLGRDDVRFSVSYGNSLGRYFGVNAFNDGYINADGKIKTFNQYGGYIAYRHFWSDRWRSSFNVSAAEADNPDLDDAPVSGSWAKTYYSGHANLVYSPLPPLSIGGELIYGYKELEDGRDGDLKRLQFSVKYAF